MSKKVENSETYSDFWLDDELISQFIGDETQESEEGETPSAPMFSLDLIQLAAYRKVISNFVSILTNKDVPVKFITTGNNSSDGNVVYLSSSIKKKKDFDWNVGLSLHEAEHIVKSDWDMVKKFYTIVPQHLKDKAKKKNITNEQLCQFCKHVWNVIEDRYIDMLVFTDAPGYRGYYEAMYNKLWNSKSISDGLKSKLFRISNLIGYEFRITNLTNVDTEVDALPGLRKIAETIDITNILRLKTTQDRVDVSFKVVEIVLDNIGKQPVQPTETDKIIKKIKDVVGSPSPSGGTGSDGDEDDDDNNKNDSDSGGDSTDDDDEDDSKNGSSGDKEEKDGEEDGKGSGDDKSSDSGSDKSDNTSDPTNPGKDDDLSDKKVKAIKKAFEQQLNFLLRNYDKAKQTVSKESADLLDIIEKAGITLRMAGHGYSQPGEEIRDGINCIVVNKLTKELMESGHHIFPLTTITVANKTPNKSYEDAVVKGFTMGKMLGKKLQIRSETNITKYIRRMAGKIDRRLLAGIGAGLEDIFFKIKTDKYNKARLHISVDASGSMMDDNKWCPTMSLLVSICVAFSMVENLKISVSFRSTHRMSTGVELPYIVLAYDSDVDKISKIRNLFPYLKASGCTPEGLAFESTMDSFIIGKKSDGTDVYFLNISDGEPYFFLNGIMNKSRTNFSYQGQGACLHTKKQIEKLRSAGIKILSYFIESADSGIGYNLYGVSGIPYKETLFQQFRLMYGKDAQFINITNVFQIAKTINGLFLQK